MTPPHGAPRDLLEGALPAPMIAHQGDVREPRGDGAVDHLTRDRPIRRLRDTHGAGKGHVARHGALLAQAPGGLLAQCPRGQGVACRSAPLARVDETQAWQQTMPEAALLVLPGHALHVAASHAVPCAQDALVCIARHTPAA